MVSLSERLTAMNKYIDVMIDNADDYYDDTWIMRNKSSGGIQYADTDIYNILQAAVKCIDIIGR